MLSFFWQWHFGAQAFHQLFSVSFLCSQNLGIRVDPHCTCLCCFHVVLLPLLWIATQRRRGLQRRLDSVAVPANFRRESTLVVGIHLEWDKPWYGNSVELFFGYAACFLIWLFHFGEAILDTLPVCTWNKSLAIIIVHGLISWTVATLTIVMQRWKVPCLCPSYRVKNFGQLSLVEFQRIVD